MNDFYLTHLYPLHMSIYGDMGNVLTIKRKLKILGFNVIVQKVNPGEPLPSKTDFYFMGGGQDNDQFNIFQDLLSKKQKLIDDIENYIPILTICGGYQLLGKTFITGTGQTVEGIGLFPVETKALDASVKSRCIGNIIVELGITELEGKYIVGFENHGGQTYILNKDLAKPIGKTIVGYGNNFYEKEEGCIYKNAIGTYFHGSMLPKNPDFANWIIAKAIEVKSRIENRKLVAPISLIDDTISQKTHDNLIKRWMEEAKIN
ncbi:MAG: type 1 glutamine amidotransferase [Patescibacteria group bacterium]